MRMNKSMRWKNWKKSSSKKLARFAPTMGVRTAVLVVICVLAAAIMIAARQPSRPADFATTAAQPEKMAEPQPKSVAASKTTAAATAPAADASTASAPAAESAKEVQKSPVTITGCLARSGESFRLNDTTGKDAPKSRSWKSGFLKKGSASIHVVDAANRLKLTDHLGQRVSVTGVLVDREMKVRSLQRVSASCS